MRRSSSTVQHWDAHRHWSQQCWERFQIPQTQQGTEVGQGDPREEGCRAGLGENARLLQQGGCRAQI